MRRDAEATQSNDVATMGNTRYRFQKLSPRISSFAGGSLHLMVTIVPMITGFWMSFHNWSIIRPTQPRSGLANTGNSWPTLCSGHL